MTRFKKIKKVYSHKTDSKEYPKIIITGNILTKIGLEPEDEYELQLNTDDEYPIKIKKKEQ